MTRDAWIGVVFLAVAVVFWIAADGIRISPLDGPVTAAGLPKSLAYALGALSALLIVRSFAVKRIATAKPVGGEAGEENASDLGSLRQHLRAAGVLAIGVVYLLAVPYLGYTLSIFGLMLAMAVYAGARFGAKTGLIAALGAVFFYFFFVKLLHIPLPPGLWPDLLRPLMG